MKLQAKRKLKRHERLNRSLSLDEFIIAFGRFKRIMCAAHAWRAKELDMYLAHIVEAAQNWPLKFYEYHKVFSANCAAALIQRNVEVDWSKGDHVLRQLICAGSKVKTCA